MLERHSDEWRSCRHLRVNLILHGAQDVRIHQGLQVTQEGRFRGKTVVIRRLFLDFQTRIPNRRVRNSFKTLPDVPNCGCCSRERCPIGGFNRRIKTKPSRKKLLVKAKRRLCVSHGLCASVLCGFTPVWCKSRSRMASLNC